MIKTLAISSIRLCQRKLTSNGTAGFHNQNHKSLKNHVEAPDNADLCNKLLHVGCIPHDARGLKLYKTKDEWITICLTGIRVFSEATTNLEASSPSGRETD